MALLKSDFGKSKACRPTMSKISRIPAIFSVTSDTRSSRSGDAVNASTAWVVSARSAAVSPSLTHSESREQLRRHVRRATVDGASP